MPHQMQQYVKTLPDVPGVYIMRDRHRAIIYVGKATSLRSRVSSYFQKAHDRRIAELVSKIYYIDVRPTPSALEALLLEARLIKRHQPYYNVRTKDDKSYLYVVMYKNSKGKRQNEKTGSKEWLDANYPALELVREHELKTRQLGGHWQFGPYVQGPALRTALEALRKVFTFRTVGGYPDRPHLYFYKGKGGAPWLGGATPQEYRRDMARLRAFLGGKRQDLVKEFTKEMQTASHAQAFERAALLRIQIEAFAHLADIALISDRESTELPRRIEGYDISNLKDEGMVGSMVVFVGGRPARDQYRRFHIRRKGQNDVAALAEVINRRFENHARDWPLPNVVVLDGGQPQLTAVKEVLQTINVDVPIVAAAKGPQRRKLDLYFEGERVLDEPAIIRAIRDEAHRFAITFQRHLRIKKTRESILDTIPGIGPMRKKALLRHFGSVERIKKASAQTLIAQKIPRPLAEKIRHYFQQS